MTGTHASLAVLALGFAGTLAAQPGAPTDRSYLGAPAAALAPAGQPPAVAQIYGTPASPRSADRSIDITASTRWINVKQGETVALRSGDRTFAWTFATWSIGSFDLNRVAPPDFPAAAGLRVYVAPNPMLDGGR